MEVSYFEIGDDGLSETRPFIGRSANTDKGGCGSPGCNCSPGHWVNISNGKFGLCAHFESKHEMDLFLAGQRILGEIMEEEH